MQKLPQPKLPTFEVTLTEQDEDFMFKVFLEGEEIFSHSPYYRFIARDLEHAQGLLLGTKYRNLQKIS